MHRLEDLRFQIFHGRVAGPRVFARESFTHRDLTLELCIVGASHLIHLDTPFGCFTEAVADPKSLPDNALYTTPLYTLGSWYYQQAPYAIQWKTIPLNEQLIEQLKRFPLVYDFGDNALTALKWEIEENVRIETAHVYPEVGKVVLTESRIGTCFDTQAQREANETGSKSLARTETVGCLR